MTKHDATRGAQILAIIEDFQAEYGYAPSIREIMPRVGLSSTSAVHMHLVRLQRAGALAPSQGRSRGYVSLREQSPLTAERIEMAWCLSTHGRKPPKVRPCKRHRVMAEWLAEVVLPKARALP